MESYQVVITNSAFSDMEDIYNYIATELMSPDNAKAQYSRIASAIMELGRIPKGNRIVDIEPWRSRGFRRLNIDNYSAFYFISNDKVIVTDVLYAKSDLGSRIKGI